MFYKFDRSELVLDKELQDFYDKDHPGKKASLFLVSAGWMETDSVKRVYSLFEPGPKKVEQPLLTKYSYGFLIKDAQNIKTWVIMVKDHPQEYLAAMKLIEPLFTRATFPR